MTAKALSTKAYSDAAEAAAERKGTADRSRVPARQLAKGGGAVQARNAG